MDRATTQTQMYIVKLFAQQGFPADPTHQHGGLLRALHADARLTLLYIACPTLVTTLNRVWHASAHYCSLAFWRQDSHKPFKPMANQVCIMCVAMCVFIYTYLYLVYVRLCV